MVKINRILFSGESTNLLGQIKAAQSPAASSAGGNSNGGTQNANSNIVAPPIQNPLEVKEKKNNTAVLVTSAIALASIGATTVLGIKNGKLNKQISKLTSGIKEKDSAISAITEQFKGLGQRFEGAVQGLAQKVEKSEQEIATTNANLEAAKGQLDKQIKDLGQWEDRQTAGAINDLRNEINSKSIAPVRVGTTEEILTDNVDINYRDLRLATVKFGYGKNQHTIENILRSEATKRIFNLVDRSKIQPKEEITARVLSADYKDFLNNGGMSVVPRDIIAGILALANTKQKIRMIVDMPLYLGEVKEGSFYSLKRTGEKTFDYIRRNKNKIETSKLELIDTREIPIYTDKGIH
ncbi:hypothetical protein IJ596_06670, partial [bacterium]|nr:hypothetical protein [bacterium]